MAEDRKKRGDLGKEKSKPKSKKKPSGHKVHSMEVKRAKSGHLVVTHKHKSKPGEMPPEDEDHVVEDGGMDDHVSQFLPPETSEEPEAPPQGANPQPGGMMGAQ